MDTLLELALTLFVIGQAIGILLGVIVGLATIVYVTIKTLWEIHR